MEKQMNKIILICAFLGLTSCAGPFEHYVRADRMFFDVQKQHYMQLMADSGLSEEDIAIHLSRLEAKELQLVEAEKLLKIK